MRAYFAHVALAAAAIFTAQSFAAEVPRKAPDFVIQMTDGTQRHLSSYRGKAVVFALMFTTCPHCQHTAQILSKVQSEYAPKGGQVVGVTFDQGAAFRVDEFNKKLGLNFPCGFADQQTVLQFLQIQGPYFVPILVFIDKQGVIRSQYVGDEDFLAKQEVNIRAELDKLLKGATTTHAAVRKTPKQ